MKKIIMAALFAVVFSVPVMAQELPVNVDPVGTVDLAKFFGNIRTGYLFGNDPLASMYVPLVSLKGKSGAEYLNLDVGVGYNSDTRKGKPVMIFGGRIDSFLRKLGRLSPNIKTAVFPPLEIGPTLMVDFSETHPLKNLKFMVSVAYKIGG